MKLPKNEIIVIEIAGKNAILMYSDLSKDKRSHLTLLGFVGDGTSARRPIQDDAERIFIIQELINLDALFSAGRDWSPVEIVELYFSKGLISGSHKIISWKSQDEYAISSETGSGNN